jgi:Photosynthesis affected mutant 68
MSASWDPDREGSFFGFDEVQKNIQNIQQGFVRTKENAVLRDRMIDLSDDEVQDALKDLDKREQKQQQKTVQKSFESRLENEL